MLARALLLLFLALVFHSQAIAQDVRIGVLGLFHPRQVTLRASRKEAVVIQAAGQTFVLEPGSRMAATLRISKDTLLLDFGGPVLQTTEIHAAARNGGAVSSPFFLLFPERSVAHIAGLLLRRHRAEKWFPS